MTKYKSTPRNKKLKRLEERTAAIYIRVSSMQQIENFSIPTQVKACREYLKKEKLREVGIFVEKGESAKSSDRTELQNLLYFITHNKNKVDFILVYKLDRWSRSMSDFYALKSVLMKNGTNLLSVTEQVDDSPTGKFLEGIFSGLAQLDNELKGQRVKDCLATKALDGWFPSHAPYGYRNCKETRTIKKDPKYFNDIRTILHRFEQGESTTNLTKYLNRLGLRTRGSYNHPIRKFRPKDVWKILEKSLFYSGYYNWGEHVNIHGKHEPMITLGQHMKIQDRMHNRETVETTTDEGEDIFYLNFTIGKARGFLHCAGCGERMQSCFSTGKLGKKYPYYYCKNPACNCEKKSIQKQDLELLFERTIGKLKPTPASIETFKEEVLKMWQEEYEECTRKHKISEDRIKLLEEKKDRTIDMRRKEELSSKDYKKQMTDIENDIIAAQNDAEYNLVDKNQLKVLLEQAALFLSNLETLFVGFSTTNKQRFAHFVFPEGVRYEDGKIRTPKKAFTFEFLEALESNDPEKIDMVSPQGVEP